MDNKITFRPTEEAMAKYKPWTDNYKSNLKYYKRELISYCLKKHENTNTVSINKAIENMISMIAVTVDAEEKYFAYDRWKNNENKELWYAEGEFSETNEFNKESVIENTIGTLVILTDVVETPDYFDNGERFYDKVNEIEEQIDGLVYILQKIKIHEIIKEMEPFKVKYDKENLLKNEGENKIEKIPDEDDYEEYPNGQPKY